MYDAAGIAIAVRVLHPADTKVQYMLVGGESTAEEDKPGQVQISAPFCIEIHRSPWTVVDVIFHYSGVRTRYNGYSNRCPFKGKIQPCTRLFSTQHRYMHESRAGGSTVCRRPIRAKYPCAIVMGLRNDFVPAVLQVSVIQR